MKYTCPLLFIVPHNTPKGITHDISNRILPDSETISLDNVRNKLFISIAAVAIAIGVAILAIYWVYRRANHSKGNKNCLTCIAKQLF